MSDHGHYAEDNLSHRKRQSSLNLAAIVETVHERELTSLPGERSDHTTWEQALEHMREEAVGFIKQDAFKERYRNAISSEASTNRRNGSTRAEMRNASAWCREVLRGLRQVHLDPRYDDAWAVRVLLLYLKESYAKQVPRQLRGDDLTWDRGERARSMMVSL